jgi:molybdopterin molybdotransferase
MPRGADSVVMVEHVTREDPGKFHTDRTAEPGQFINPQGCEARAGEILIPVGKRLSYADVALLAAIGHTHAQVFVQPGVAILATGDEIVPVNETPLPYQIRNSNAYSLAAQVARAGGRPRMLPVARDEYAHTRGLVEQGLTCDLLLISGGVSAGKYDIVERVLTDCGAEFFFDRVWIQPGQPLVFGRAQGKFLFGLPGNPASTMVTFEIFARAALELLSGQSETALPFVQATLTKDFRHRTGITRFLPARLGPTRAELTPLRWSGSGDVPALSRANAYLVADADRAEWKAGETIHALLQ